MNKNEVHITPIKTYLAVGIALMILTGITVGASFINFGPYNVTIALVIASIKALLVALFFMHLFWDNKIYLIIFAASLLFFTIFLTFSMFDTMTRGAIYEEQAKPIKSEAPFYQKK
jgi:cytochrome c oxidase subunit 4